MDFDFQGLVEMLIPPVISSITTLVVLGITGRTNRKMKKDQIRMQRVEKLYTPFYIMCMRGAVPENDTLHFNFDTATRFLDLFSENVMYMGTESQRLYKVFYLSFLDYFISDEDENQKSKTISKSKYDSAFRELAKSLQTDYQSLCRKLKLEQPIELF